MATQSTSNIVGAAPAGALTTAVDRMSFAHDIVMMTDSTIAVGIGSMDNLVNHNGNRFMFGDFFTLFFSFKENTKPYKDPLRELILMTEESASKVDEQYASNLAKEAAVLNNVREIHLETNLNAPKTIQKPVTMITPVASSTTKEVSNLTAVFQDKKDTVDPVKEREFLMKLNAMEESDTEFIGNVERPILGKVSLMRRAKSAVSRSIIERRINDKHPLFNVAWESQKSIGKSDSNADSHTIDMKDGENGSDDDIPTPEEVKRHMELFHLRRGQPPSSAKLEDSRKSKHSKNRSARTTKSNRCVKQLCDSMKTNYILYDFRVAPADDIDETASVREKPSRIHSARVTMGNEQQLSPDPLEPWSTKDLLDINKILES